MTHVPTSQHIQARWNSIITDTLMRHAGNLKLVPYGEKSRAKLPVECHTVIARLCDELLEQACKDTVEHPKGDAAIQRRINARLWNALALYSPMEFGKHEQLSFDPYPTPIASSTRDALQTSARKHHTSR
jgi:hypothetical protein